MHMLANGSRIPGPQLHPYVLYLRDLPPNPPHNREKENFSQHLGGFHLNNRPDRSSDEYTEPIVSSCENRHAV